MSVNLVKGQKVNLVKSGGGGSLRKIMVGLGWDEVQQKRGLFAPKPQDIDCDASVILCGANGKILGSNTVTTLDKSVIDQTCVYFGNTSFANGAIRHSGDDTTGGSGDGADVEMIVVDLPAIPSYVEKMAFVVNIYDAKTRNQHFGMVRNAYIRIVDMESNNEVCRFNLSENYSGMTGMVAGEIFRGGADWKFDAVGQPVKDASRLSKLIELYR